MLDAERLLKAGYLALCHGDTKTSLTEKGSRPRRRRLHKMFRAKAATGTEKLIGTGLPLGTKPPSRRFLEMSTFIYLLLTISTFVSSTSGLHWRRAAQAKTRLANQERSQEQRRSLSLERGSQRCKWTLDKYLSLAKLCMVRRAFTKLYSE